MACRMPFCNHKTAYCPSPCSCRGRKQHFQPHFGHSHGESSLFHPFYTFQPTTKAPSQALRTHRRHTVQQPPKTRPTRLKHPPTSTKTQPFTASIVGPTPRFRKVREQSQVHLSSDMTRKGAIKWNHYPKPPKSPHPHHFTKYKYNNFTMILHKASHNFTLQQIIIQIPLISISWW